MRIKDTYISPFTDFGFKKLFGTEVNKDLLIDFLNELLSKSGETVVDLTYLSTEQLGRGSEERKAIYDIYCKNEKGEYFIVEMQKAKQKYFKDRSIYYSSFPIQSQAEKGDWNFELKAIYTVGILDFVFKHDEKDDDAYYHKVKLMNTKTSEVFYDKLTYVYLELPKFNKAEEELETHFEKWLFILKNLGDLTSRPQKLQERIFKKVFEQAEIANYSDNEYAEYEESLKTYRDLKNSIDSSFEEGKIEGIIEGKAEGIIEGEIKGKIETATAMKKKGYAVSDIAEITGISAEEIEKL